MRAARTTFAELGYERATPAVIAAAAGIGRTALYNYFDSKSEIYRAVILDVNASVLEHLFGATTDAIADPVERLVWMLRESARLNSEDSSIGRFLSTMLVDASRYPEFAELAAAEVERTRRFFIKALRQAIPHGDIAELVDLSVATQWGLGLFAALVGDASRVDRVTERLINLITSSTAITRAAATDA
jgi:AcrR family transcriptional regulator